jgi:hypothetical protein
MARQGFSPTSEGLLGKSPPAATDVPEFAQLPDFSSFQGLRAAQSSLRRSTEK